MMFVAFAIEGFVEVQSLLPCAELNFYRPACSVNRDELTHVGLLLAQMGQHEVLAVAKQAFRRAGILDAIPCFLTMLSAPSCRDLGSACMATRRHFMPRFPTMTLMSMMSSIKLLSNFPESFIR